jgi:hypothetical protein
MPNGSFSSSSTISVVMLLMAEPGTGVPATLVERGFESGLFRPVPSPYASRGRPRFPGDNPSRLPAGKPAQAYQPAKLRWAFGSPWCRAT